MNLSRLFWGVLVATLPARAQADLPAPSLLSEGVRELRAMRSSAYRHKTSVDESAGRFDFDCSGFLDYALARVDPRGYAELPISKPRSGRPLAQDYFERLAKARPGADHWIRVARAIDLMPGDVIAWLLPRASRSKDTGHVMVVAERVRVADPHQVLVKVIDSAASRHAEDSRSEGQSGLGTGTIAILNDAADSEAVGFYWLAGESKKPHFTRIVFGRLRN